MKLLLGTLATLLGLSALPARADDCCAPCCGLPAPQLRLTVVPEKYTECVPGKTTSVVKAVSHPVEYDVTVCRSVPVCFTDPHTGQTCTRYEQQTCVERVKATVIDYVKEEVVMPPKVEEKVRNRFIIGIGHAECGGCAAPCGAVILPPK
jgi:hypothetical protein